MDFLSFGDIGSGSQIHDSAPYTLLAPAIEAVKRVVGARLALFNADP